MRYSLAGLRREVFRILQKEVAKIEVCPLHPHRGESERIAGKLYIKIDAGQTRIDEAVVHEILHDIADGFLTPHFRYGVYEWMIAGVEDRFFRNMSRRDYSRWRRAIRRKLVKSSLTI